jgi:glycosyltransferase involved in cell wall biosynthesis
MIGPQVHPTEASHAPASTPRMNEKPLVTIAIPTYNRAGSYLPGALKSALEQTYSNLEVIVADNCSTDGTEALVTALRDPRLRYFKQDQNIGANANVNFCVERARGKYLLILHDDDLIDRDFVEVCVEAAEEEAVEAGLVRTGMRVIDSTGNVLERYPDEVGGFSTTEFFLGWFAGKTPMHLCCTLFNTAALRSIGGFRSEYRLFDDVIAEVKIAAGWARVDIRDIKASFRRHGAQGTQLQSVANWCEESAVLLDVMCALVPDEDVARVRMRGLRFLAWHNYNLARRVDSPVRRFAAYRVISRKFGFPFRTLVFRGVKGEIHRRRRRVVDWLAGRPDHAR